MSDDLLNVSLRGFDLVKNAIAEADRKKDKALSDARKIELFRLRKLMMARMRENRPGNVPLKETSFIRRIWGRRRMIKSEYALRKIPNAIKYLHKGNASSVGFTENTVPWARERMLQHQKGFDVEVTDPMRRMLARRGGKLMAKGRKLKSFRNYFFLKKSTRKFHIPARNVVEPFYEVESDQIKKNIARNFRLKMLGKRI